MTSKLAWVQKRHQEVGGTGTAYSLKKKTGFSLYCSTVYHYHPKLPWSYYFDSCFEWMIDPILMDNRKKVVGIGLLSASASLRRSLSLVLGARPLGDGMLRTERHTYPQLPALSAQCATHTLSWRHPGFEPWTFRSEGGSPTD